MQASLTIIRYPKLFIPFAFFAMAIHRLPLLLNKKIRFYKLLGCGKHGTFDKVPDLQQWGILAVHSSEFIVESNNSDHILLLRILYGSFISSWLRLFRCETFTILLEPLEGHGLWDGKEVFGALAKNSAYEGPIAILTRATIRFNKLKWFWQHVAAVTDKMNASKGFITSLGIGEVPWIKQATFSVWESKADMMAFAYGMKEHTDVIKKTREQQWYSEEMFVRFKIIGNMGTINGKSPLKGKL
ncbi:MAG: spheroidene monooxygenase [Ferruginibacter sp.]